MWAAARKQEKLPIGRFRYPYKFKEEDISHVHFTRNDISDGSHIINSKINQ